LETRSGFTEAVKVLPDASWLPDRQLADETVVIDNRTVITGSLNWSPSAAHQNDEVLLVIHSPLIAAHFTREMDRLWKGAELGITEQLARKLQENRRRCGSGVQRR
jgi:phosphatidylserine/phosphatidylglycerophosphate/cardiolipin synthase-like enzyme